MVRRHKLPGTREVDFKSDAAGRRQGRGCARGRLQWRSCRAQASASGTASPGSRGRERAGAALLGTNQPRGASSHVGADSGSHTRENIERGHFP